MVEVEAPLASLGTPHRFTVDAYHRMLETGILDEDDHVELLEGVIVEMSPQGKAHAGVIVRLTRLLVLSLGESFDVRPQLPLTLDEQSEPEPDLAVVPAGAEGSAEHPSHALLVVEVANASLARDREVKARLYARASIPEYWLVDVGRKSIEVYRDPDATQGRYRSREVRSGGEVLECRALPGVSLPLLRIFG
ncbi:Uma2 family endonuclease [Hyalangium versicolor]|uniref:Uma2 family endonuclease n=1 Tax=Hyalangium versicolor TaxID=2861190 RepID=UPI001CCF5474|nr:Uma2 family endonuclease [Hyalangium versicolor]